MEEKIKKDLSPEALEVMNKARAREDELSISLWEKLGVEGLNQLAEMLIPNSDFNVTIGYQVGYGDNYAVDGVPDEMIAKEAYARRKCVERVTGIARRIHQVGFPIAVEEKKKSTKKSFK